mmetsp:Transcript_8105/g.16009  ORF Transcript_8105/g.16009 Transcript_8105/m.16009 type:complete len:183 (-) Transcript_8105:84-632(-)
MPATPSASRPSIRRTQVAFEVPHLVSACLPRMQQHRLLTLSSSERPSSFTSIADFDCRVLAHAQKLGYTETSIHTCACMHEHLHMHAYLYSCTHTRACTCTHTHAHAHTHMHTRTHTHTRASAHAHTHSNALRALACTRAHGHARARACALTGGRADGHTSKMILKHCRPPQKVCVHGGAVV